jgi:hypothetical protein
MAVPEKKLKVDSRGRINIKQLTSDEITSYRASRLKDGSIMLRPLIDIEIPPEEAWLYKNQDALDSVKRGLEDAAAGKIKKLDNFFDDIEDEE